MFPPQFVVTSFIFRFAQVIKQLRENKKVVRPYIGMKMVNHDKAVAVTKSKNTANGNSASSGDNNTLEPGVVVVEVVPGSPAGTIQH